MSVRERAKNIIEGLKLKRRVGERVFINNGEIIIQVVDIQSGNKVTLGIKADPEKFKVDREERLPHVDVD